MSFELIKKNYDRKLWNKAMVAIAVVKGVITDVQYKEITGDDYVAPSSVPMNVTKTLQDHETALNELARV